MPVSAGEKI